MIDAHTPESAAVEEVFYAQNVKTALKLAHVRGVALLAIAEAGLALGEYSPLEVKTSVVGYGRAEKHQVQAYGAVAPGPAKTKSNPKTPAMRSRLPSVTPRRSPIALEWVQPDETRRPAPVVAGLRIGRAAPGLHQVLQRQRS